MSLCSIAETHEESHLTEIQPEKYNQDSMISQHEASRANLIRSLSSSINDSHEDVIDSRMTVEQKVRKYAARKVNSAQMEMMRELQKAMEKKK